MVDPGLPPLNQKRWRDYETEPMMPPYTPPQDQDELRRWIDRQIATRGGSIPSATASSANTTVLPNPMAGQYWWVEDAATRLLIKVKVIDVTPKTIEVSVYHPQPVLGLVRFTGGRYRKGFLTFVEQVAENATCVESEPAEPTS